MALGAFSPDVPRDIAADIFSGFANRIILFDVSRQLGVSPCPHRLYLIWWFTTGDDFAPQGTFGNIWRCFWLLQLTGGVLLESSG